MTGVEAPFGGSGSSEPAGNLPQDLDGGSLLAPGGMTPRVWDPPTSLAIASSESKAAATAERQKTVETRGGEAEEVHGLSPVGSPPVTRSSHTPLKSRTAEVPPYSRWSVAPSTSVYQATDVAMSVTTMMCVSSVPGAGNGSMR